MRNAWLAIMRAILLTPILAAAACTSQGSPTTTATTQEAVGTRLDNFTCANTNPGVWDAAFFPQQTGRFTISFSMANTDDAGGAIDAVAGLSNGPAASFSDLGPIVRLAPDGFVDARNGGAYQRDAALDYTLYSYDRIVWIQMDVDLPHHTYSVWAHHDGRDDNVQIAHDYAFRTEQAGLSHIDTIGRYVDSSNGILEVCDLATTPPVCANAPHQTWSSTAFPEQTGAFRVEIDATPQLYRIDGVVGLAAAAPAAFTDLGPIARFNADGTIDARDGDVYRSDVVQTYYSNNYRVAFDVDLASHTYSVTVYPGIYDPPVAIATGYRFRTEQADVASLSWLGQYVDQPSSDYDYMFNTCDLTAMY